MKAERCMKSIKDNGIDNDHQQEVSLTVPDCIQTIPPWTQDDNEWLVPTSWSSSSVSVSSSSSLNSTYYGDIDEYSDPECPLLHNEQSMYIGWEGETICKGNEEDHTIKSNSKNKRTNFRCRPRTTQYISKLRNWLESYSTFVTKTGNQEVLLKLMQWSLWVLGAFLAKVSISNEDIPHWITKISYDICYARYVTRLLGLPVAMEGAISGSWASSSYTKNSRFDRFYYIIGNIMAYSMVAYYPVEHIAFFLWMNPSAESLFDRSAETWFYMSMRCWLVYILTEQSQCVLKYYELYHHKRSTQQTKKNDSDVPLLHNDSNSCADNPLLEWTPDELNTEMFNVMLLFIRNLLYLCPCIHWSMSTWDTDPWLPDIVANGLMWLEAVLCLYQVLYNL